MRIAINTRLLLKNNLEGIGWFTFQLFKRISQNHPEHQFIFFFDRQWDDEFIFSDNVIPVKFGPPTRHPLLWHYWFNYVVPKKLKKYKADVFVSPDGFISLNTTVPTLQIIHDLNFEHNPEYLRKNHRKYMLKYFKLFAQKASRIVTVSNYSKNDVINLYGINEANIDVVYNSPHEAYKPITKEEKQLIKQRYSGRTDYFLFVSAFNPRKNIANVLKAFTAFYTSNNKIKLVMVGEKQFWNKEMEEAFNSSPKTDIVFTGRLGIDELSKLMGGAMALLYPSKFEGFGIPIVEAMKCGVPVITSNTSSMPEVAGNAALLVNPESIKEIEEAMIKITTDSKLRNKLIEKGLQRANEFSWDKSAEQLWQSILRISGS